MTCEHSPNEDCLICRLCGNCSESLNDDNVCANCLTVTKLLAVKTPETPAKIMEIKLPLTVTVEVEGGCVTEVFVNDAAGEPVDFVLDLQDHDVGDDDGFASFNRFELRLPQECVDACSHSGECEPDVNEWINKIERPAGCTPDELRKELREYGAWDDEQLSDDAANWKRIIWIAACNLKDENCG